MTHSHGMTSSERFASALSSARAANGMTQAALGVAAGLSPSYVAHLEAGRKDPRWSTVCVLARELPGLLEELAPRRRARPAPKSKRVAGKGARARRPVPAPVIPRRARAAPRAGGASPRPSALAVGSLVGGRTLTAVRPGKGGKDRVWNWVCEACSTTGEGLAFNLRRAPHRCPGARE
jgi:transcriptional regulator with XRE-family HTH domain